MCKLLLATLALVPAVVLAQGRPHLPQNHLPSAAPQNKTVFIGGTRGFYNLANPTIAKPLIATGRIGLYQHAAAMSALSPTQRTAILTVWAPTGTNPTAGGGQGLAETTLGGGSGTPTSGTNSILVFGGQYPVEVNTLTYYGTSSGTYTAPPGSVHPGQVYGNWATPSDAASVNGEIDQFFAYGAKNAAVAWTPNGGNEDVDDPYSTSGFWENARATQLYGGGGFVDTPATNFWHREEAYRRNIAQQIAWMNAHGLRSEVLVSPFLFGTDAAGNSGADAYDPQFFENTKKEYYYLKAAGALPTQWGVENYANPNLAKSIANIADGGPEGLDTVALWLANVAQTTASGTVAGTAVGGVAEAGLQATPRRPTIHMPCARPHHPIVFYPAARVAAHALAEHQRETRPPRSAPSPSRCP